MKKLIYFFGLFALFSCTSGDNGDSSSNTTDTVLVKKIVYSDGDESNYSYNGTKLNKIIFKGGDYMNFTYSGDFITKIEWYSAFNVSEQRNEYTYSSNKLIQMKLYSTASRLESVYNYNYNTDGSVTVSGSEYNGVDMIDQGDLSKIYFDVSGNKIKEEYLGNNVVNSTYYFTYDIKNSLYKNITGLKYLNSYGETFFSVNNLLSEKYSSGGSSQITTNIVNTYQYNNQDYPISVTSTRYGETTSTGTIYY